MIEKEKSIKNDSWESIIGLEIHAQIVSKTKLFSGSSTLFGSQPNSQVSFFDSGMPGTLPVLNRECVNQVIKTGIGLNGTVNKFSRFDRKNYFYPDLPHGYQITQYHFPIISYGYVEIMIPDNKKLKRINISRIHLEQDAGKSLHELDNQKTYIDLNRAGVALMEIVTEPSMNSSSEAMEFVKKLRSILRYLRTCDGNMEHGNLRVDANISVRKKGESLLGIRVEIKNLNSIKFLGQALDYEFKRQINELECGRSIKQETRLFDPQAEVTRSMRSKENANDYRYFPDPDLPPLILDEERIRVISSKIPELPDKKRERFIKDYKLTLYEANTLSFDLYLSEYYEECISLSNKGKELAKHLALWIIGEVFSIMNRESIDTKDLINKLPTKHFVKLIDLIDENIISGKVAKSILTRIWGSGENPEILIKKLKLEKISDYSYLENIIDKFLSNETDKIKEYKSGKEKMFGYFVGCIIRITNGKADPVIVNSILSKKLN